MYYGESRDETRIRLGESPLYKASVLEIVTEDHPTLRVIFVDTQASRQVNAAVDHPCYATQ